MLLDIIGNSRTGIPMPVRQRTLAPALRLAQVQVWGYVGYVISDKLYLLEQWSYYDCYGQ